MSNNLITKLHSLENATINVNVSQVSGSDNFVANVQASTFNPSIMLPNGGPVVVKGATFQSFGKSFEEAKLNGLIEAAQFLGLGEE